VRLIWYICLWFVNTSGVSRVYNSWKPIANVHWVCTERCARTCLWNVLSLWTRYSKYHLYIYLLVKVNTFLNKVRNFRWLYILCVKAVRFMWRSGSANIMFDIACLCKYYARDIVNYYCWIKWSAKWNEFQLFICNINLLKPGSSYTACTARFNTKNFTFFLDSVFLLRIRRAIRWFSGCIYFSVTATLTSKSKLSLENFIRRFQQSRYRSKRCVKFIVWN